MNNITHTASIKLSVSVLAIILTLTMSFSGLAQMYTIFYACTAGPVTRHVLASCPTSNEPADCDDAEYDCSYYTTSYTCRTSSSAATCTAGTCNKTITNGFAGCSYAFGCSCD